MNLILLEPAEVDAAGRATLRGGRAAHVRTVLRAAPGKVLKVGVIDGPKGSAEVVRVGDDGVELACALDAQPPPPPRVHLLLAVPRPKVLGRLWAPLASLGVRRILLTNAAKVERNYFDTHWLREDAWRPLVVEGLQQAADTHLPRVSVHRLFRPLVEDVLAADGATKLVADPGAPQRLTAAPLPPAGDVMLAVGPEGGWTPFEVDLLRRSGFLPVHVGPRLLRTDTACVALLALVHDRLDGP